MGNNIITLEEAMLMAGFGKFNIGIFILTSTIMVGMIFETLGLSFIIPAAQCDLELNLEQKGWLAAIPFIGIISTSHFWGWLADTRGRKLVIKWSITIGSVLSIISSFCPNLISFALVKMVGALFAAGPTAVVYAYLGELHTPKYRDGMVVLVSSFMTIGTILVPGLAWSIYPSDFRFPIDFLGIEYRPWRLLVVVCALPYLICAVLINFAPESPKFLSSTGKSKEALDAIKKIYRFNNGSTDNPFEFVELEDKKIESDSTSMFRSMWNQTVPLFKQPLLFFTIISCLVLFITFSTVNGFYLWLPEILNRMIPGLEEDGVSNTLCEMYSSNLNYTIDTETTMECNDVVHTETFIRSLIMGAIYGPFPCIAGLVVNILGKRNILMGAPFICGLCALALHWSTNEYSSLALLAIMQIDSSCIGVMNAVIVENFPTNVRAMAVSFAFLIARFGSVMGSNLIGYLLEYNCPVCFFLYGGLLLFKASVCYLLPKQKSE